MNLVIVIETLNSNASSLTVRVDDRKDIEVIAINVALD